MFKDIDTNMKVSVIIPVYNEEREIAECLGSLADQTYKDLEILVVDDGSVDGTLDILKKIRFPAQKLRIFRQKHGGAGKARNFGARRAEGEILVFLDADMTFDRDFVKKLVDPIVRGDAVGTFSKEEYLANKDNAWARCWNINRGLPVDRMHPDNYPGEQKVFRAILKSEFDKAGGFDEKAGYIDDWSLSEKLGILAKSAPGAIFYHKNPADLREVFIQSRWMSKRKYKAGFLGYLFTLLRASLPVSAVVGLAKSIRFRMAAFLPFKIVADMGVFVGVLEYWLLGRVEK